jgi:dipeptidase D
MNLLSKLRPSPLWNYFEAICKIPRLSKNEGKIREYLLRFATENNLESREDETGNIVIIRKASAGMENRKTIVLQSHMDMVGEKNSDYPHDWNKDPIVPVVGDEWVSASGTTLGADDGIGIAAQMAILTDTELRCGTIECLFTVDEETGMTGAFGLKPDFFSGRTLLNLDSEDEGILFIGCAGGTESIGTMNYNKVRTGDNSIALELSVTGLRGGHSGDEIHKGFGNSVKIMARLLLNLAEHYEISVSSFDGGNLRNAIPREAFATVVSEKDIRAELFKLTSDFEAVIKDEFGSLENELSISVKEVDLPPVVLDQDTSNRLLNALNCFPHGVISWSKDMADLVETSTNLASVKTMENGLIKIVTSQRSSVESGRHYAASIVGSCMKLAGAEVTHSDGYPGWKPDISSEILKITSDSYRKLFGKEPLVKAIHAGLECGLFFEKFKGIDMISFGPTIKGAHTPQEMIEIKTVQMFWDLLTDVIKNTPSEESTITHK